MVLLAALSLANCVRRGLPPVCAADQARSGAMAWRRRHVALVDPSHDGCW
ncbi:hypothetical protein ACFOPN_07385 [Xanthomonas hyacinthi]